MSAMRIPVKGLPEDCDTVCGRRGGQSRHRLREEQEKKGLERERELQRQRIEISQTIHDTTAQWAYMLGVGVERAMGTHGQFQR